MNNYSFLPLVFCCTITCYGALGQKKPPFDPLNSFSIHSLCVVVILLYWWIIASINVIVQKNGISVDRCGLQCEAFQHLVPKVHFADNTSVLELCKCRILLLKKVFLLNGWIGTLHWQKRLHTENVYFLRILALQQIHHQLLNQYQQQRRDHLCHYCHIAAGLASWASKCCI